MKSNRNLFLLFPNAKENMLNSLKRELLLQKSILLGKRSEILSVIENSISVNNLENDSILKEEANLVDNHIFLIDYSNNCDTIFEEIQIFLYKSDIFLSGVNSCKGLNSDLTDCYMKDFRKSDIKKCAKQCQVLINSVDKLLEINERFKKRTPTINLES